MNNRPLKKTAELVSSFLSEPNSIVMFFDEGRFGLQSVIGRCWVHKGKRKQTKVKTGYQSFYVYAGVSPQTGESCVLFLPWINTEIMNIYLDELSKSYNDKRILIIMDQAGWHKSKNLILPKNIQIEFLPPYSPELNPVEKLWQWLRRHVCRNRLFESERTLMDALSYSLNDLSKIQFNRLCQCSYLLHYK